MGKTVFSPQSMRRGIDESKTFFVPDIFTINLSVASTAAVNGIDNPER